MESAPKIGIMPSAISRRELLFLAAAGSVRSAEPHRLIIDTHLEVWTFDPKFPFHHPEHPELKRVPVQAPIENEVSEMQEFGLKYAVLINPRYYGWDNSYISYSLHKYPKLFVAHGLLDPEGPDPAGRLRYWIKSMDFRACGSVPSITPHATWLNSKEQYPLWREAERLGAVFNFYILPHQMPMLEDMAERFPGVKIVIDHLGKPDLDCRGSLGRLSEDVPAEALPASMGERFRAVRDLAHQTIPLSRYISIFQSHLRGVRRKADHLGNGISKAALGTAHEQGT